jgi:hypothetical protein
MLPSQVDYVKRLDTRAHAALCGLARLLVDIVLWELVPGRLGFSLPAFCRICCLPTGICVFSALKHAYSFCR